MGHGSIIDFTVILFVCAQPTVSVITRDTTRKYRVDYKNDMNNNTVYRYSVRVRRAGDGDACTDLVEKKENTFFYYGKPLHKGMPDSKDCVQWCLENVNCTRVWHRGNRCVWTDVLTNLYSHPGTHGYTSYTIRYRCPKYHTCGDQVCRNRAACEPVYRQNVGIQCMCLKGSSGWYCERQFCYDQLCLHGGTCRNTKWGFTCTCPDYVSGVHCEYSTVGKRLAIIVGSTLAVIVCGAIIITAIVTLRRRFAATDT